MKEIYADFNDLSADRTLPLTCVGSRASIDGLSEALKEGEEVKLTDGELVTVATVHRREDGTWEAHSDWKFQDSVQGSMRP